jgi:hypothetical protein
MKDIYGYGVASVDLATKVCANVYVIISKDFVDVSKYSWNIFVVDEKCVDLFFFNFYGFSCVDCVSEISPQEVAA